MNALIDKETNACVYIFSNDVVVKIQNDSTIVGDPVEFIIADMNLKNCKLIQNVEQPENYMGWKYLWINGSWQLNPDFKPPTFDENKS